MTCSAQPSSSPGNGGGRLIQGVGAAARAVWRVAVVEGRESRRRSSGCRERAGLLSAQRSLPQQVAHLVQIACMHHLPLFMRGMYNYTLSKQCSNLMMWGRSQVASSAIQLGNTGNTVQGQHPPAAHMRIAQQ